MKLLLTGASGQIGFELARSLMPLGEVVAPGRDACDLARPDTIAAVVAAHRPDVIINAAAYTAVDQAESEERLATTINGDAAGALAKAARAAGALLIHYSTDYVFDGSKSEPWLEDDPVAPLNAYGRSKLAGEHSLAASGADYLVLRTSWVYAARGANFVRTMLRLGMERETLRVVADQCGCPTWARNIADATAHITARARIEQAEGRFSSATLHLASAGETSWHGFAQAILAQARQNRPGGGFRVRSIEPIASSEYPAPAVRPRNSRLDCARLAARFDLRLPHWHQGLVRCLEEID